MKLKFALVGLAALGGAALSTETASSTPIGLATSSDIASNIDQVRLVCNAYGRCWRTPGYAYGYYGGEPVIRYGHGGYGYGTVVVGAVVAVGSQETSGASAPFFRVRRGSFVT